jgi:hypothetical protein
LTYTSKRKRYQDNERALNPNLSWSIPFPYSSYQ